MVKEFRIVLNTPPNQVYFPGSEVSGTLVVEVKDQPRSYKYIRISLQGDAHVKWSQVAIGMSLGIRPRLTVRTYTSKEVYVSATLVVWSRELSPGCKLEHGSYSYPFQFTLPSVLPSSFQSSIGIVHACVRVCVLPMLGIVHVPRNTACRPGVAVCFPLIHTCYMNMCIYKTRSQQRCLGTIVELLGNIAHTATSVAETRLSYLKSS